MSNRKFNFFRLGELEKVIKQKEDEKNLNKIYNLLEKIE